MLRAIGCVLLLSGGFLLVGCGGPEFDDATQHMIAAREALQQGDDQLALKELTASIESGPDVWAFFERAKLHSKLGNDAEAKADCKKALELDPENKEVLWLQKELDRPTGSRFQAAPPSHSK